LTAAGKPVEIPSPNNPAWHRAVKIFLQMDRSIPDSWERIKKLRASACTG
jgi:hypothetical protein